MIIYFLIACLSLVPGSEIKSGQKPDLTGKVISIADGDTFKLLTTDNITVKIRLNGIDAPEKGQDYANVSKEYLGKLLLAVPIKVVNKGKDKYGRILGDVYTGNGQLINLELVKAGMAWHFIKYSADPQLAAAELDARLHKAGLWQQPLPTAPWDFRKRKRKN